MKKPRKQPKTPELDKQSLVHNESQAIGEFVEDFLREKGLVLAKWNVTGIALYPAQYRITELLAEFYDIDLKKIEKERTALLDWIAAQNK